MSFDLGAEDRVRATEARPPASAGKRILGAAGNLLVIGIFLACLAAMTLGSGFKPITLGFLMKPHDFGRLYARYGVKPIPSADLDDEIVEKLAKLEAEPCDWQAMDKIGKALVKADDERIAADFFLSFSRSCGRHENAQREAAVLYSKLSDYAQAKQLFADLVTRYPQNGVDWYNKARAEAKLGLNAEALQSYATTISLTDHKERILERVFYEMAEAYAAQGHYCEAMTPIDTYVSLDPATRDTSRAHQVQTSYAERGKGKHYASGSASFPVFDNNVVNVRATINGVTGLFTIDTGASFVALTPAFAARAHVVTDGGSVLHTTTANGVTDAKLSKASTISLGGLKATDVPLVVIGKSLGHIDGLLGRSFLARYELTIGRTKLTLRQKVS